MHDTRRSNRYRRGAAPAAALVIWALPATLIAATGVCRGPDPSLELRYTDQLELVWDNQGSGSDADGAFYRPIVPPGYHALGHHGQGDRLRPRGYMLVARELEPGALAPPAGYELIWADTGSGASTDGSFWRPLPPAGYLCLGSVAQTGYAEPSGDAIRCVRSDLTIPASIGGKVWDDRGSGAASDFDSYHVVPDRATARDPDFGIDAGTFVAFDRYVDPATVAEPVHCISARAVAEPEVTAREVERLIATYGPVIRLHPDDTYLLDDPDAVLDTAMDLHWGLVENTDSYDTFTQTILGTRPTSSATLMDDVAVALADPNAGDGRFRYWLHLDDAAKGGDLGRARAFVRVKPWNRVFLEIQFWLFYPFNGPGKFRVRLGVLFEDHVYMDEPGRHYGDWEQVSLRIAPDAFSADELRLAFVYMSRHSGDEMVSTRDPRLTFRDATHPIVYSSRDSHAHYPTPDTHYYMRVAHIDLGIGHLDVDLEDWTADGGPDFDTHLPENHVIISSTWPHELDATPPPWLPFEGRWGQYEKLSYTYDLPIVGGVYTFEEIGNGPTGPAMKSEWPYIEVPLLRDAGVLSLDPLSPPRADVLPVDPPVDLYLRRFAPGELDPELAVLADVTRPLVFYEVDRPGSGPLCLGKTDAGRIRVHYDE